MKSVTYHIPIPFENEKPCLDRMIRRIQTRPGMYLGSNARVIFWMATKPLNGILAYAGMAACFRLIFNLYIVLQMPVCIRSVFAPDGAVISSHIVRVTRRRR